MRLRKSPRRGADGRRAGRLSAPLRGAGEALRAGGRETRERAGGAPRRLAGRVLSVLIELGAIALELLRGLLEILLGVAAALQPPLRRAADRLAELTAAASRELTPVRAMAAVAIGCAVLLGLSQFADYRGVAVSTAEYREIETVAPPPQVGREETGSAHSYLMVPAALLAIAAIALAVRSRRWQLSRLAVAVGLAAVLVGVLVDRPAGLDEGSLSRDFAGAEATLLGGFWMQIFAGLGLAATASLLAAELRPQGAARRRAARGAGGLGSGASPEGAGA